VYCLIGDEEDLGVPGSRFEFGVTTHYIY